jgi:hypothetical protein
MLVLMVKYLYAAARPATCRQMNTQQMSTLLTYGVTVTDSHCLRWIEVATATDTLIALQMWLL